MNPGNGVGKWARITIIILILAVSIYPINASINYILIPAYAVQYNITTNITLGISLGSPNNMIYRIYSVDVTGKQTLNAVNSIYNIGVFQAAPLQTLVPTICPSLMLGYVSTYNTTGSDRIVMAQFQPSLSYVWCIPVQSSNGGAGINNAGVNETGTTYKPNIPSYSPETPPTWSIPLGNLTLPSWLEKYKGTVALAVVGTLLLLGTEATAPVFALAGAVLLGIFTAMGWLNMPGAVLGVIMIGVGLGLALMRKNS